MARRLRELREHHWPDAGLTQADLAKALSQGSRRLAVSTISSWENTASPTPPPTKRLAAYAAFFATRRSLEGEHPRVLGEAELDDAERAERERLLDELQKLRGAPVVTRAESAGLRTWRFGDNAQLRLICGELPPEARGALAEPRNPNRLELALYADLDAMVELFAHVRAENPGSDVRFKLATNLQPDDLSGHVVLLGGLGWNQATQWFTRRVSLPVRQVDDPKVEEGEVFEVTRGGKKERFYPVEEGKLGLTEDVGLLVRMRNPLNSGRTLTICNGTYARGVMGAVRCLTDQQIRENNEAYLARKYGPSGSFGVLMRVPVMGNTTLTPDLNDTKVRLFEWPA